VTGGRRWLLLLVLAACSDRRAAVIRNDADAGGQAPPPPASDAGPTSDRGFVGVLVASELVDVAPRFAGRVITVHVRAGDKVPAGAPIAEMDPAPLREEVRTAEAAARAAAASLRQAEVDLADARRKLDTERAAVAAGTSARQNLEAAQMAVQRASAATEGARSQLAQERSRLETARSQLADAALRAPFAGTVAIRYKDPGATVGPGTPIVQLVGEGELRLRFAVPPERAAGLQVGAEVSAAVDTIATRTPAVVRQISPALDPASGMVLAEAELTLDAADRAALRPGMAAWVYPR